MKLALSLIKFAITLFVDAYYFFSASALAQWGPGPQHIHEFHERHAEVWRGGNWYHGNCRGRFGWYWVVGGAYYFYPKPIYPYPDPYVPGVVVASEPVAVAMPPPPSLPAAPVLQRQSLPSVWYFCESSQTYYPYVAECASGWKAMPARPPQ